MIVKLESTKLIIDLGDVLGRLTGEELHELVQHISCEGPVINAVADQIVDGHTENGSWGGDELKEAAQRVAANSSDVAMREVKALNFHLDWQRRSNLEMGKEIRELNSKIARLEGQKNNRVTENKKEIMEVLWTLDTFDRERLSFLMFGGE